MDLIALDSLRADTMRALLTEEGQQSIWLYDVCTTRHALSWAIGGQSYDDMIAGVEAQLVGKPYALIGPGIVDCHFTTPEELVALVCWLCRDRGYLSCYYNGAQPFALASPRALESDHA